MIALNNTALQYVARGLAAGNTLEIYSGTMPATFNLANAQAQLLAKTTTGVSVSYGVGTILFGSPPPRFNATTSGTATWFAIYSSGNTNISMIGDVTDVGPNIAPLLLDSVTIVAGQPVNAIQLGMKISNA